MAWLGVLREPPAGQGHLSELGEVKLGWLRFVFN